MRKPWFLLCLLVGLAYSTATQAQQITILNRNAQATPLSICQCDTLGVSIPPGTNSTKPSLRYDLAGPFSATTNFEYEIDYTTGDGFGDADSLELYALTTIPATSSPVDTFGTGEKRAYLVVPCNAPIGQAALRVRNSNGEISDTTYYLINRIPSEPKIDSIRYDVPNFYTTVDDVGACLGDSVVLYAEKQPGASYQWLNGGSPIPFETDDSLVVKSGGSYSVRVDLGACARDSKDTLINFFEPPTTINYVDNDPRNATAYSVDWPFRNNSPADSVELCIDQSLFLEGPVPPNSDVVFTYQWLTDSLNTNTGLREVYPVAGETNQTITLDSTIFEPGENFYWLEVTDNFCTDTSESFITVFVDTTPQATVAGLNFPGSPADTTYNEICMKDSVLLSPLPNVPDPDWKYRWQWYDRTAPAGQRWRPVGGQPGNLGDIDTLPQLTVDTSMSDPGQPYFASPKPSLRYFRLRISTETLYRGIETCVFFSDSVAVRWFPDFNSDISLVNSPTVNRINGRTDSVTFCIGDTATWRGPSTPNDLAGFGYFYDYQWLTDSLDPNLGRRVKYALVGDTNQSLRVTQTGNYFLVINDGICSDTSNAFRAFVDTIPQTTLRERLFPGGSGNLTNLNLCLYDSALVSAVDTVLGLRPWDYQWQQLNPVTGTWSNLTADSSYTITIDTSYKRVGEDTAYFRLQTSYENRFGFVNCGYTTDSIAVVFYQAPNVSFIPGDSVGVCPGDSILFVAQGNFTSFSWQNGQVLGASRYISVPGSYPVRAVGVNSCVTRDTVIVFPLTVSADAGSDQTVRSGELVQLSATGGTDYRWFASEPLEFSDMLSQTISVRKVLDEGSEGDTITIYVEVTNSRGCVGLDSLRLIITAPEGNESVDLISKAYNVFTPNGDGLNDLWDVTELVDGDNCSIMIMNRWGSAVFEDESFDGTWTGVDNGGNPLPDGTYYYVLDCGGSVRMKNAVTIIRNQ